MGKDLSKIKDKYGEDMMRLCRELFPTILEENGKLFELLSTHFAYSRNLYNDIVNNSLVDNFKNYIYGLLLDNEKVDLYCDNRTPFELLDEAGYILYECKNEDDIQSFRKYYKGKEAICTLRGNRLRRCYVFFAIKKNVDEIKREDFINPYRQDLYGTSVISIQFTRGDVNTVSIKNRYNHTVINPDATFSNNLENIIPGLTKSFENFYNLNISQNKGDNFEIPGYVKSRDIVIDDKVIPGKYYKYNYEINNIYYCENNIIIDNFDVVDKYIEKEKYILMDYFIIDLVNKKIMLYDNSIHDSFVNSINKNIKKIDIVRDKNRKNRRIKIVFNDDTDVLIEIDDCNRMISYVDKNIVDIPYNYLKENIYLRYLDISNCLRIGDNVLYNNKYMNNIIGNKILEIGDNFLYSNECLKEIELSCVIRIGDCFLYNNGVLNEIVMNNLGQVGDSFLYKNVCLKEIYLPSLLYVLDNFIACNKIIDSVRIDNLVNVGNNFLASNKNIDKLYFIYLRQVGDNFLRCNEIIREIYMSQLEIIGNNFMYSNRQLLKVDLSKVRLIENNFLYKNNSVEILDLSCLEKVGHCFMKENNSLLVLLASRLRIVGINFLCNNSVVEYVDLSMLEDYGRDMFRDNLDVKRRVLCI